MMNARERADAAQAGSLLVPTGADVLRKAVERLRGDGLTRTEAAAEVVRENLYEWLDQESDTRPTASLRLRIVKR